jgi:carboxylate-amine ligase
LDVPVAVKFPGSPRPTLGVEWEIALVDRESRDLANIAAEVLARVREDPPAPRMTEEFLSNTVELVTGVRANTGEAMADLDESLGRLRRAAAASGADPCCAGTHPFARWNEQTVTDTPDYNEIIERTQWWGRQMLIWGVHCHVGISSTVKVWPIINALLPRYPHLLALSASSPMWEGMDTGYASNRALMYQQLPTAGLPYQFDTWPQYEEFVGDQLSTGVIWRVPGMHWDIRPAPKWGTIEVRICDGASTKSELRALVALTHCLIVDLDRRFDDGQYLPRLRPWHVKENKGRAARYGLDAEIIVGADNAERLVVDDLFETLERLRPVARDLGCLPELESVAEIPRRGASYQRQRRRARESGGDWRAGVAALVRELAT